MKKSDIIKCLKPYKDNDELAFISEDGLQILAIQYLVKLDIEHIMANKIADFFIWFCAQHGDVLTNLKLQKLLYFAQGWHLAFFDKALFKDEIQAWISGGIVPNVWKRFRKFKNSPITLEIKNKPCLDESIENHLKEVFLYYGKYSAYELELLCHKSIPWLIARKDLAADAPSYEIINLENMKKYYKSLIK